MEKEKYIKFSYEIDMPYCNFNELSLLPIDNDSIFKGIEFKDDFATLYCKNEFILDDDVERYAERKLFAILLGVLRNSNAQRFKVHIEESYIDDKKRLYTGFTNSLGMSSSAAVEVCRADGSVISEDEHNQKILERNKFMMMQIVQNSNEMMAIQESDRQSLVKLFTIDDPVIKYFILYSWLSKLLLKNGREYQDEVNTFIVNSNTYTSIPDSFKHPPLRNGKDDKTYFTYLRNLMGHTVTDALLSNDAIIVDEVKNCTNWLIQILIERLI